MRTIRDTLGWEVIPSTLSFHLISYRTSSPAMHAPNIRNSRSFLLNACPARKYVTHSLTRALSPLASLTHKPHKNIFYYYGTRIIFGVYN